MTDAAESLHPPTRWPIGGWERADEPLPAIGAVALRDDPAGFSALLSGVRAGLIVAGPFVEADRRIKPPSTLAAHEYRAWTRFLSSVPQKEPADVDAAASLLATAESLSCVEIDRDLPDESGVSPVLPAVHPVPTSAEENRKIEVRYADERAVRQAISRGDRDALIALQRMDSVFDEFAARLPDDPPRLRKNLLVALNTIGRLSAERGGVLPFELHTLSESYALQIERCRTPREAEALASEILLRYCDAVRARSLTSYSPRVRRAATYILQHLERKLTLGELAALSDCNPSYLSRRFRAETGRTITEYVQSKRIAAACWLLEQDTAPITEIAFRVGFEDPNYFSRVFRSHTGITAREYQRDNSGGTIGDIALDR